MKKFHQLISIVFQPLLMPTFGILMLISMPEFHSTTIMWKIVAVTGTFFFTGLMPAIPILWMLKKGNLNDLFISKKEQRTLPYLFSFISYLFWTYFLYSTLNLPLFMVGMGIGVSISIVFITFINLRWKISAHLSGIGGLVGGVFGICFRMGYNPIWLFVSLILLSGLLAYSRIELKAHTPTQTLGGFTLGFISVFIPCNLLN